MTEDNRGQAEEPAGAPAEDAASPVIDDELADSGEAPAGPEADEGPVRRPLIRATLRLPEGVPPTPRQPPVFTMHQQPPRSGSGQGRGGNWTGRPGGGQSTNGHPNRKKASSGRRGHGGGGNRVPSRTERHDRGDPGGGGQRPAGSRRSSSRRDKNRSR